MRNNWRRCEGRALGDRKSRSLLISTVVLFTMLCASVWPGGIAGAATPVWTIAASPGGGGTAQSILEGTSCLSASFCVAVGYTGMNTPLVETWNGSAWSTSSAPDPTGSSQAQLDGVSCFDASDCVAVGYDATGDTFQTLIESWNGVIWSISSSPNVSASGPMGLSSVSCSGTASCDAVGYSSLGTLVEQWNGFTWTIMSSPNPGDSDFAQLNSVSCSNSLHCMAVGYSGTEALSELWNGSSWTLKPVSNPSGSSESFLYGVSCVKKSKCVAVGDDWNGSHTVTLIESWSGTTWSVDTSPNPTGSMSSPLQGVFCRSATDCVAVGPSYNGSITTTLVELWNGKTWTVSPSPNPSGSTFTGLLGVSCSSTSKCSAVGYFTNSDQIALPLIESGTAKH
jgi:hypothetical protein